MVSNVLNDARFAINYDGNPTTDANISRSFQSGAPLFSAPEFWLAALAQDEFARKVMSDGAIEMSMRCISF